MIMLLVMIIRSVPRRHSRPASESRTVAMVVGEARRPGRGVEGERLSRVASLVSFPTWVEAPLDCVAFRHVAPVYGLGSTIFVQLTACSFRQSSEDNCKASFCCYCVA